MVFSQLSTKLSGSPKNIDAPRVPPIIEAKWFVFCVGAVDVSGEVAARAVDEIDEVDVLVEEDGSVVTGAEDDVVCSDPRRNDCESQRGGEELNILSVPR